MCLLILFGIQTAVLEQGLRQTWPLTDFAGAQSPVHSEGNQFPGPQLLHRFLQRKFYLQTRSICLKLEMDLLHWKVSLDAEFIHKKLMRKGRVSSCND